MKTYTLQSVNPVSLLKFGFFFGLIGSLLPVSISVLIAWSVITDLLGWMDRLTYQISIPIPILEIPDIEISIVNLLHLEGFYETLSGLIEFGWIQVIILITVLVFASAFLFALFGLVAGFIFNILSALTGGLQVNLLENRVSKKAPLPASAAASSPPASTQNPAAPGSSQSQQRKSGGPRLEIHQPISQIVPLSKTTNLRGSDANCQVHLDGLQPQHAQIAYQDGQYTVSDLSQGQTWVRGNPLLEKLTLEDGEVLQMGLYVMTFRD